MASTAGVPRIILELVIDALINSMNPLPLEALAVEPSSSTIVDGLAAERHNFLDMCLVHSTWTDLSRRALFYRGVLHRLDNPLFLDLPTHSQNCLLFQEVALLGSGFSAPYLQTFANVIRHSPNLRKIYLDIEVEFREKTPFLELLQQLRLCSRLESLWLIGEMEGCYDVILPVVADLSQLKVLVMETVNGFLGELDAVQQMEPPKNLKSIGVVDGLDWPYFEWLIRPREGYRIANLSITLHRPEQLEEEDLSIEHFFQAVSLLETLDLSTGFADRDSEYDIHNDWLQQILSRTQHLQRFSLSSTKLYVSRLRLPETVAVFHFHYDSATLADYLRKDRDFLVQNDRNIASAILESCPTESSGSGKKALRTMILSFTRGEIHCNDLETGILPRLENEVFVETYTACRSVGVDLKFKTYASEYFGPLAEDPRYL